MNAKTIDCIAWILVVIGGINWGLVGFFHLNLVALIFAAAPVIAQVIYAVVGLAALWQLYRALTGKNIC